MTFAEQLNFFYETEGEEELRLRPDSPHYTEFLVATKYLAQYLKPNSQILDSCAGSGAYAFYLAERGHLVTAGDIVPYNVEIIRRKQTKNPLLADVYQGDAQDLSRFPDTSFDAVLCMGALYHLHDRADREKTVAESLRLLPAGGLFACTYMNRYAVIMNNCQGDFSQLEEMLEFAATGREDIFHASTPAETENLMAACGVEKLCHVALDGMGVFLRHTTGWLNETGFRRWREYHMATCEVPELLGASYHNLFLGRKTTPLVRG